MLDFDIDFEQLDALAQELEATDVQVKRAFSRALNRTAKTLRVRASKGLKDELKLRTVQHVRRRLKGLKLKRKGRDEVGLWVGMNDLPLSSLKGRIKKGPSGYAFHAQHGETYDFPGAFISRVTGKRSLFARVGQSRLPIAEQAVPVEDRMTTYLEDEIFTELESIFFHHFIQDLRFRVGVR